MKSLKRSFMKGPIWFRRPTQEEREIRNLTGMSLVMTNIEDEAIGHVHQGSLYTMEGALFVIDDYLEDKDERS